MGGKAIFSRKIGRYFRVCGRQEGEIYHRTDSRALRFQQYHNQTISAPAHRVWLSGGTWWQQEQNVQQEEMTQHQYEEPNPITRFLTLVTLVYLVVQQSELFFPPPFVRIAVVSKEKMVNLKNNNHQAAEGQETGDQPGAGSRPVC